ncbi:MAG: hypothetical protein WCI67_08320 [Chloroflexales bacterium]
MLNVECRGLSIQRVGVRPAQEIFMNPSDPRTLGYISGRFG